MEETRDLFEIENRMKNLLWTVSGDYTLEAKLNVEAFKHSKYSALYDAIKQGAMAKYFSMDEYSLYLIKKLYYGADETGLMRVSSLCIDMACAEKISAERIQVELVKLLTSDHPDYLRVAYETGITAVVLPEFDECMKCEQNNSFHIYTVGEHTLHSLLQVENDKVLRLTMLFHDFGKPMTHSKNEEGVSKFYGHPGVSSEMAREILRRLKFDNDTTDKVKKLVAEHDRFIKNEPNRVRRALSKITKELFPYFLKVRRADILSLISPCFKRMSKSPPFLIVLLTSCWQHGTESITLAFHFIALYKA